jgi:hypothetical protein
MRVFVVGFSYSVLEATRPGHLMVLIGKKIKNHQAWWFLKGV